jgi:hypothetical protein
MTVIFQPPHFSLFPRQKRELKGRHFDTPELIEAALNTITEHGFQEAFKKMSLCVEEDYFKGEGGQ